MLEPTNDLVKIKLDTDGYNFDKNSKDTAETGILVALPDKFTYFGMWSFAFEESFMNEEKLQKIYDYWTSKIGKRVFWTALSEKGNILKDGDDSFALVKITSLIAIADADSTARNIHSDGAAQFRP